MKSKNTKKRPNRNRSAEAELTLLTQQVMEDQFGEDGVITREFQKQLSFYGENHPIGEETARELLLSMAKLAAAQRKTLASHVIRQVEKGSPFKPYFKRLRKINKLAVKSESCRREAASLLNDYSLEQAYFRKNKIKSMSQDPNNIPSEEEIAAAARMLTDPEEIPPSGGTL